MIRMTRQADYGIVLLTCFTHRRGNSAANARDLAAQVHLPVPMVSKILKALVREGLLTSRRGIHGGYCMARPATDISVAEVICALEGPIGITECSGPEPTACDIAALCAVRSNLQTINRVVRRALDHITLAEMAGPLDPATAGAPAPSPSPPSTPSSVSSSVKELSS